MGEAELDRQPELVSLSLVLSWWWKQAFLTSEQYRGARSKCLCSAACFVEMGTFIQYCVIYDVIRCTLLLSLLIRRGCYLVLEPTRL